MPQCEQDSGLGDSNSNNSKGHKTNGRYVKNRHPSAVSSSSDSSSEWSDSSLSLPPPPDGGYGWVIVLASFFANFFADGCAYSYGVIYVELLQYFNESRSKTALIGALFISVPLITGPIASALTNKYGCRKTCMAGGLISGIGFFMSSFVRRIDALCITFGVVAGFGLALVYVPSLVVVAFYFEKRRAFATGLAVAGNGIGTFIMSPMIERLIEEYAWHGTFLIMGAIMLNIVVCGALFRPLVPQKILWARQKQKSKEKFSQHSSKSSIGTPSPLHTDSNAFIFDEKSKHHLMAAEEDQDVQVTHSLVQLPTYLQKKALSPEDIRQLLSNSKNSAHLMMSSNVEIADSAGCSSDFTSQPSTTKHSTRVRQNKVVQLPDQYPMYRKDIFYRGSLLRTTRVNCKFPVKATSCPDVFLMSHAQPLPHGKRRCDLLCTGGAAKRMLNTMLDMSIFKSIIFIYFCVHSFLLSLTYDIPYVYMVDRAIPLGIPEHKSSFLVSIIGITSTVGQIFAGLMGDQPRVNSLLFYNTMTALAGACTILVPFLLTFETLAAYSALYGFFISANYAMTTIIIVELLDMDRLTNAFGIVSLAEGIANLLGTPLAGLLTDITHSFDTTFFVFGGIMLFSGVMMYAIPFLTPYDKFSRRKSQESSVSSSSADDDLESEDHLHGNGVIVNSEADNVNLSSHSASRLSVV